VSELLALADADSRSQWDALTLGYTEPAGLPALREEVARCVPSLGVQRWSRVTPSCAAGCTATAAQSTSSAACRKRASSSRTHCSSAASTSSSPRRAISRCTASRKLWGAHACASCWLPLRAPASLTPRTRLAARFRPGCRRARLTARSTLT
jgi:hypothetical protein